LHGFYRDVGGNFVPLDVSFPNANNTTAYGLNNQGPEAIMASPSFFIPR